MVLKLNIPNTNIEVWSIISSLQTHILLDFLKNTFDATFMMHKYDKLNYYLICFPDTSFYLIKNTPIENIPQIVGDYFVFYQNYSCNDTTIHKIFSELKKQKLVLGFYKLNNLNKKQLSFFNSLVTHQ